MSDWQVGDLALCVKAPIADPEYVSRWNVVVGRTYGVIEVGADDRGVYLNFAEDPYYDPGAAYEADAFRKITPDKHEQCEPEFITLLQRIKRTQVA